MKSINNCTKTLIFAAFYLICRLGYQPLLQSDSSMPAGYYCGTESRNFSQKLQSISHSPLCVVSSTSLNMLFTTINISAAIVSLLIGQNVIKFKKTHWVCSLIRNNGSLITSLKNSPIKLKLWLYHYQKNTKTYCFNISI